MAPLFSRLLYPCFVLIMAGAIAFIPLGKTAVAIDVSLSTGDLHYNDGQGHSMPYRLYLPPGYNTPGASFPLIMFLHGSGESGTDNVAPSAKFIDGIYSASQGYLGAQYKAFLLVPQTVWGWQDYGPQDPDYVGQSLAMDILNSLISTYQVDTSRLYRTGLSMGGFGTFDFIAHYPNTFAAAAPLSGGGDISTASIIKDIPIWAYHGVADTTVPVSDTDEMFDAIEAAGGNMEYTRLDGVGHGGWSNFYDGSTYKNSKGQTVYQWMFAQSLPVPEPSSAALVAATLAFGLLCRRPSFNKN
ncbi:MAG: PHB depolymerase family esterase [Thermoguttaceae bacterium]